MRDLLIALLLFLLVLTGSSCVRYKASSMHTRDTVYISLQDTTGVKPKDSSAVAKTDTVIETVFVEIERDCPQLSGKTGELKARIKTNACSMESLTGGELKAHSPDLRSAVRFIFKGNEVTAVWDVDQRQIEDKKETTVIKEVPKFITPPWLVMFLKTWQGWIVQTLICVYIIFRRFK